MVRFEINPNGDTPATLRQQAMMVRKAAVELRSALEQAAPHGRNYQTNANPEEDFRRDREMHAEMLQQAKNISQTAYDVLLRIQHHQEDSTTT